MHEREVGRVQEVFNRSEPAGFPQVGPRVNLDETVVRPLGKLRNVVRRRSKRRPDEAIPLGHEIRKRPGLRGRRLMRGRGDQHAGRRRVVAPAMVRTDDRVVHDAALGQTRAAMDTEVFPGVSRTSVVAPENQIAPEQAHRQHAARSDVATKPDHMPVIEQRRVVTGAIVLTDTRQGPSRCSRHDSPIGASCSTFRNIGPHCET